MIADERVTDLLSEWEKCRERGQPVSPEALCRDCPELLLEVTARIRELEFMYDRLEASTQSGALPAHSLIGEWPRLEGYEILGELGAGGMGVVYKARQVALKRVVALKTILVGRHAAPEQLARFRAEAEAMARLQHPHIVQVFDIREWEGMPCLALEYVAGGSLATRLKAGLPTPEDAARLLHTLAEAVHHAHERGIVHRDLKPGNVLMAGNPDAPLSQCTAKVTDFGLVKFVEPQISIDTGRAFSLTVTGQLLGTPSYMAPEQAVGDNAAVGPAADVYALGVILYELLTGQPPFKGDEAADILVNVVQKAPQPPREMRADVPVDLETICLRCLQKLPSERYLSTAALAEDLSRFLHGKPLQAGQGSTRLTRRQLLAGGLGLAVMTLGGVSWYVGRNPGPGGEPPEPPPPTQPVEVLRLRLHHFRGGRSLEFLGEETFTARLDDTVTVEARLSRPAYAYLLAFRPDGGEDLCFPEREDEPPPLTDQPSYPLSSKRGLDYGLTDGTGLQVFALVASSQPLPSYHEWKSRRSPSPWKRQTAPGGIVWYDDGTFVDAIKPTGTDRGERGKDQAAPGKTAVVQMTDWLRQATGANTAAAIGFMVQPKDQ